MFELNTLRAKLQPYLGWHSARLLFIATFIIALLRAKTVNLSELAVAFPGPAKPESYYKLVTYTLELDGKFFLIEDVPARVNEETGEQFFAAETVERLQSLILDSAKPQHFIKVPVYRYMNSVA